MKITDYKIKNSYLINPVMGKGHMQKHTKEQGAQKDSFKSIMQAEMEKQNKKK